MYTFLLLAIPCTLLLFLHSSLAKGSYWAAFSLGFFPAVAYCFVDEFFIFSVHHFTDSFPAYYAYVFLKEGLLPAAMLCTPYLLLSRRRPEDRSFALLVVLCAFHMVYLPYSVLTGTERCSPYLCLVRPLLSASAAALLPLSCMGLYRNLADGRKTAAVPFAIGIPAALLLPPLADSLWYLDMAGAPVLTVAGAMLALETASYIFLCKTRSKSAPASQPPYGRRKGRRTGRIVGRQ